MQKPPIHIRFPDNFQSLFALELLKSERRRYIYGAIISCVGMIVAALAFSLGRDYFIAIGDAGGARYFFLGVPVAAMMYELACARILQRRIEQGEPHSTTLGLLSAILEPTALTLWLAMEGIIFNPGTMFNSPVSYLYPIIVLMTALQLSWRLCVVCSLVASVEFLLLAAWQWPLLEAAFHEQAFAFLPVHGVRSVMILQSGLAAAFLASEVRKGIEQALLTLRERDFVVSIFGRYLTDDVVDEILRSPEGLLLGGKRRTVTLVMTDLRGFSSLSETLAPESVIAMLNNCLATMTDVIVRYRGTIDEFIGDAIMAIFGAPLAAEDDAERAVACAIRMQIAMEEVNAWNKQNGFPRIEMGIGIHTGQVVVGNIGSEKRSKYGVVGSAVNLTSRIESYTVGGQILASSETVAAVRCGLRIDSKRSVHPKGSAQPIEIHDLVAIEGEHAVELPARHFPLIHLAQPIPVQFIVLEGKDAAGPAHGGTFTELGEKAATLSTPVSLPDLGNLRIQFLGQGDGPMAGFLSAKITGGADGVYALRFTAVDAGLQEFMRTKLSAERADVTG